ncbi:MAG: thiamine diphosphokinase [Ruminococcaceae bacterium]|nr:thiamine diphosphokinase [Oscillospiraceae bacterium]
MKRCVIVGGVKINNYEFIRRKLRADDFVVFCDSGLRHMEGLGVMPSLIVGDFDSYENPQLDVETIVLPREKDDTDTFFAAKEAVKRGYDDFLLIGVTGERIDHTMGNISILMYLESFGKRGIIIDDYSEISLLSKASGVVSIGDEYSFFSLIAVEGSAKGVTIKGAKYPLDNAEILPEYQYGVSNEVVSGEEAVVSVEEGKLLLVKVF